MTKTTESLIRKRYQHNEIGGETPLTKEDEVEVLKKWAKKQLKEEIKQVVIHFDGGCSRFKNEMTIGVAIYESNELIKTYSKKIGYGTNNIAEWSALVKALEFGIEYKGNYNLIIRGDSQLVVYGFTGKYRVSALHLKPFLVKARELAQLITVPCKVEWVPREQNYAADDLT